MYMLFCNRQGISVPPRLNVHLAGESQVAQNTSPEFSLEYLKPPLYIHITLIPDEFIENNYQLNQ